MKYLELTIGAVLVNNFVLTRFLGICPFLGVSKRLDTALGMQPGIDFMNPLPVKTHFLHSTGAKIFHQYI